MHCIQDAVANNGEHAMKSIAILALSLALSTAAQAASDCKGLAENECTGKATCQWVPERIKDVTKTFDGKPHKRSAKAHCRLETIHSARASEAGKATTEAPAAPAQ
jgi:hypothetical protein